MTQTTMQNPLATLKDLLIVMLILAAAVVLRTLMVGSPASMPGDLQIERPAPVVSSPLKGDE